jgi:hypothetical protein
MTSAVSKFGNGDVIPAVPASHLHGDSDADLPPPHRMVEFSPDNTRVVIKRAPGFAASEDGSCFLYKGGSGVVFQV